MSIQQLLYRIQFNEDEHAFNELYLNHAAKLCQFANTFLNDKEAGEEIVNDVFMKIWTSRQNLDKIKNIQVYLYVAVKNGCLNYLRSTNSKKGKEGLLSEAFYFHLSTDPAQLLISKELQIRILIAVNELPARCKLIFKMVKEDGLTCNEVADILNLSNKTIFAQLAIALNKLESVLG